MKFHKESKEIKGYIYKTTTGGVDERNLNGEAADGWEFVGTSYDELHNLNVTVYKHKLEDEEHYRYTLESYTVENPYDFYKHRELFDKYEDEARNQFFEDVKSAGGTIVHELCSVSDFVYDEFIVQYKNS